MSPLAALTAILMGSAIAIATGLAMVLAVFVILGSEYPRLASEHPTLLRSLGLFTTLAVVSVAAFYGLIRHRAWRWYAQAGLYAWLVVVAWLYWPKRQG